MAAINLRDVYSLKWGWKGDLFEFACSPHDYSTGFKMSGIFCYTRRVKESDSYNYTVSILTYQCMIIVVVTHWYTCTCRSILNMNVLVWS